MKCPNCGAKNQFNSERCSQCNSSLRERRNSIIYLIAMIAIAAILILGTLFSLLAWKAQREKIKLEDHKSNDSVYLPEFNAYETPKAETIKEVESLIIELIDHYYDMNNQLPEINVSKNDAGEYLYKFNILDQDYKIKIVADGVAFSFAHGDDSFVNYTIKDGKFVLSDQAYIQGETESFKQFFCEKIVGKPYTTDNAVSTPEPPVNETPDSGTTPYSQQGELISLNKFLLDEGFSTKDNVSFWKYEDETVGSAYSVTFTENRFSYRYDKDNTKKGRVLYADYPEGYKLIDGEVYVTKKDANNVLKIIMSSIKS